MEQTLIMVNDAGREILQLCKLLEAKGINPSFFLKEKVKEVYKKEKQFKVKKVRR